jgi:hypothetical protein
MRLLSLSPRILADLNQGLGKKLRALQAIQLFIGHKRAERGSMGSLSIRALKP